MFTQQLKYSEHPLEHLRPSSPRVYPHSQAPDSTTKARVALNKVAWVIGELLETELAYLGSLRDIKEGYYLPLLDTNKFDVPTLDTIFSNVLQLYAFHQSFSEALSRNQENLMGLADVFLVHAMDFEELYVEFCTEHSLSIQTLEHESQMQSELWASILGCQSQLGHLLPLASYLLKPVQRILKYQLLLQELVKCCTLTGLDYDHGIFNGDPTSTVEQLQNALERMIQVANHINEAKRCHELIGQLKAGGLDVDQWGRLLLRDVFRLPAKKHACRLVLLFERAILLAKKFSYTGNNSAPNLTDLQSPSGEGLQSVLEIRDIISVAPSTMCNNLMLIECIDKDPLAFHILPFDNPSAQKTLQAANVEVKQLWCREIKRVILENFDAAIPEKAKHLMLHMDDLCPRPRSSDANNRTVNHAAEDLEEEQVPRRKGSSVLTAIFKRKTWTMNASATKSPTMKGYSATSSIATNNTSDSGLTCNEYTASEDNDTDAEHVALVQDAWNALMAKHSTPANIHAASPPTASSLFPQNINPPVVQRGFRDGDLEEEDDFRCIAVEINEERFAVDLASPVKSPEFKPTSPPKGWLNGSAHNPLGASLFIECQEASQYDTITFGRAYEQYIAKTRSMATLSPGEMDEILRPLLNLSEDHPLSSLTNGNRLPTLASSEDCSEASSLSSSSSSMSVRHLVSQIAIDTSSKVNNMPSANGSAATPASSRKNHRSPQPPKMSSNLSRPNKEVSRPPTVSPTPRIGTSKAPQIRKYSAPSPSVKVPRSKPPRTLASTEVNVTPTLRSNQLHKGSGNKAISVKNGPAPQPKATSSSATASNAEAAALCQGRLRAAVANLKPSDEQHTAAPQKITLANPSKPPRRSMAIAKTIESNAKSPRRSPSPPSVRGPGHVRHLIDRFQNN
ncbi:hypothetical protein Aperf_G00000049734 [Anoplocephala perfoliata]